MRRRLSGAIHRFAWWLDQRADEIWDVDAHVAKICLDVGGAPPWPTGMLVGCLEPAGHPGAHRNGWITWKRDDDDGPELAPPPRSGRPADLQGRPQPVADGRRGRHGL